MAWNGSKGASAPQQKTSNGARAVSKGALAGLIVVLGAGAAIYFLLPASAPTPKAPAPQEAPKVIEEIKPEVATNVATVVETKKTDRDSWIPADAYQDERGVWRHPGGARVFNPKSKEKAVKSPTKSNFPMLKHPVEREIATLITAKPGMILVGSPKYEAMRNDFVNAIVDKIEIKDDDSEWDRMVKTEVEEVKRELAERVKQGEDLVDILKESRQELQRLSQYKREVQAIINAQVRDAENSDDDVEMVLAAANKMLEERGIAPIQANSIMKRRQRILVNEARKAGVSAQ